MQLSMPSKGDITKFANSIELPLVGVGLMMGATADIAGEHGPGGPHGDPYTWSLRISDAIYRITGQKVNIAGSETGLSGGVQIKLSGALNNGLWALIGLIVAEQLGVPYVKQLAAFGKPLAVGYMIGGIFDPPEAPQREVRRTQSMGRSIYGV